MSWSFLHLIHPMQFPTVKLHDDAVQPGALAQCLHPRSLGDSHKMSRGNNFTPYIFTLSQKYDFYAPTSPGNIPYSSLKHLVK